MTNNQVNVSVKMPADLRERIDTLARKQGITRNKWINKTLKRESRYCLARETH